MEILGRTYWECEQRHIRACTDLVLSKALVVSLVSCRDRQQVERVSCRYEPAVVVPADLSGDRSCDGETREREEGVVTKVATVGDVHPDNRRA